MRRSTRNQIRSRLTHIIDAEQPDVLLRNSATATRPIGFLLLAFVVGTALVIANQWPQVEKVQSHHAAPTTSSSVLPESGVVVSVSGKVAKPGLYTLALGARVADAITAAGGAQVADIGNLNLAARLVDGQQVVVGAVTQTAACTNLNLASEAQLADLPGIGPVMAKRIADWRATGHVFTKVGDLQDISGIGPALVAKIGDSACI